jgi:hypothetical protein
VSGAVDVSYRSAFSSSATFSRYLVADGYHFVNARIGFRAANDWTVFVWSRNLLDKDYFELLTAAPGNTGVLSANPETREQSASRSDLRSRRGNEQTRGCQSWIPPQRSVGSSSNSRLVPSDTPSRRSDKCRDYRERVARVKAAKRRARAGGPRGAFSSALECRCEGSLEARHCSRIMV